MSHWPSLTHLDRGAFSKACARSSAISELIAFPWMATISWNDSRWSCSMFLSKMDLQLFPQCFHRATAGLGPTSHCSATRADCSERMCCASSTASCSRPHTRSHQVTAVRHAVIFLGVHSFSAVQWVHWNRIYKIHQNPCISMHVIFIVNLHTDFDSNLA